MTADEDLGRRLEEARRRYHHRELAGTDPIVFLYHYEDWRDREVVGLVAACLAYGRVAQIRQSVGRVLGILGPSPAGFLGEVSDARLARRLSGFRHRFADAGHVKALLAAIRDIRADFGSLNAAFREGSTTEDDTVLPALRRFCARLRRDGDPGHLVPMPEKGSAMKRMNLYLRWMVREDDVDPGGWSGVAPRRLVVPLDTHLHRAGRIMGFTARGQADMKTALEITAGFRRFAPEDPVRYDFALTRPGILGEKCWPACPATEEDNIA